jgi:putative transposase
VPKTTNSAHNLCKYPNLLVNTVLKAQQKAWVRNIMYLCIGLDFGYLPLLTDAYSKLMLAIATAAAHGVRLIKTLNTEVQSEQPTPVP